MTTLPSLSCPHLYDLSGVFFRKINPYLKLILVLVLDTVLSEVLQAHQHRRRELVSGWL